jgi:hypothetical protein
MTFSELATLWAACEKDTQCHLRLKYVGAALTLTDIESTVKQYSEGWLGAEGHFARVVARAIHSIK